MSKRDEEISEIVNNINNRLEIEITEENKIIILENSIKEKKEDVNKIIKLLELK